MDAFYEMIEREHVKKLLSRSSYSESYLMEFADRDKVVMEANRLEVHNERAFAVRLESGFVTGQIDRLIFVWQGNRIVAADVIDFKTDAVDMTHLQEAIEQYRPQLGAYRVAVSKLAALPLEKISTRIAFVETGEHRESRDCRYFC